MTINLNERIKVVSIYDPKTGNTLPYRIKWQNDIHTISKINYYHKKRVGRTIFHVYHVTDGATDFRLTLDSETLSWRLEEVCDALSN